jgi:hypothetical protein
MSSVTWLGLSQVALSAEDDAAGQGFEGFAFSSPLHTILDRLAEGPFVAWEYGETSGVVRERAQLVTTGDSQEIELSRSQVWAGQAGWSLTPALAAGLEVQSNASKLEGELTQELVPYRVESEALSTIYRNYLAWQATPSLSLGVSGQVYQVRRTTRYFAGQGAMAEGELATSQLSWYAGWQLSDFELRLSYEPPIRIIQPAVSSYQPGEVALTFIWPQPFLSLGLEVAQVQHTAVDEGLKDATVVGLFMQTNWNEAQVGTRLRYLPKIYQSDTDISSDTIESIDWHVYGTGPLGTGKPWHWLGRLVWQKSPQVKGLDANLRNYEVEIDLWELVLGVQYRFGQN